MSKRNYLESPIIPHNYSSFHFGKTVPYQDTWFLCSREIRNAFEGIPSDAQFIQFRAYRKDGPDRYKIKFDNKKCTATIKGDVSNILADNPDSENFQAVRYLDEDTYARIMDILGRRRKTWYIKVFYWN